MLSSGTKEDLISIYISVYSILRYPLGVHVHELQLYFSDKTLPKKESVYAHVCVVCVCEYAHNPLGVLWFISCAKIYLKSYCIMRNFCGRKVS